VVRFVVINDVVANIVVVVVAYVTLIDMADEYVVASLLLKSVMLIAVNVTEVMTILTFW
jgi:hypothetical protein